MMLVVYGTIAWGAAVNAMRPSNISYADHMEPVAGRRTAGYRVDPPSLVGVPTVDTVKLQWNDECYQDGAQVPCSCGVTASYDIQRADPTLPEAWRLCRTSDLCNGLGCEIFLTFSPRSYLFRVVMTCGSKVIISGPSTAVHLAALPQDNTVLGEQSTVALWDVEMYNENGLMATVINELFFWVSWTRVNVVEVRATFPGPPELRGRTSFVPVIVEYFVAGDLEFMRETIAPEMLHRMSMEVRSIKPRHVYSHNQNATTSVQFIDTRFETVPIRTLPPEDVVIPEPSTFFLVLRVYVICLAVGYVVAAIAYYAWVVVKGRKLHEWVDVYIFPSGRFCRCWIALDELEEKQPKHYLQHWIQYHALLVFGFIPLGVQHERVHRKVENLLLGKRKQETFVEMFLTVITFAFWPYGEAQQLPGYLERLKTLLRERKAEDARKEERKQNMEKILASVTRGEITHPSHTNVRRASMQGNNLRRGSTQGNLNQLIPQLQLQDLPPGSPAPTSPNVGECIALALKKAKEEEENVVFSPLNTARSNASKSSRMPPEKWGKKWTLFGCPITGRLYWYNRETKVVIWKPLPEINVPEEEDI